MPDNELNELIAKTTVKYVEHNAEIARQMGYAFPREYDFGFSSKTYVSHKKQNRGQWRIVLKMRIEEFSSEFDMPLPGPGEEGEDFVRELVRVSGILCVNYVKSRPEFKASREKFIKLHAKEISKKDEDELFNKAETASSSAIYKTVS